MVASDTDFISRKLKMDDLIVFTKVNKVRDVYENRFVGLANLKLLDEGGIVNSVKNDTGPYFQKLLREVFGDHPLVGEIQGVGHVAALQLVHSKAEKRRFDYGGAVSGFCANCARDEGLIVRSSGCGRIILAPALVATRSEIDELIEKLKIAFEWVYPKIEAAKAAGL